MDTILILNYVCFGLIGVWLGWQGYSPKSKEFWTLVLLVGAINGLQ